LESHHEKLQQFPQRLRTNIQQFLLREKLQLEHKTSFFKLSSPDYILSRGYSITLKNGKAVKSAEKLQAGDEIVTRLAEGSVSSIIYLA
jgi:exodeoxyribonuclease VII large subunit